LPLFLYALVQYIVSRKEGIRFFEIQRAVFTRWLSHQNAVESISKMMVALFHFFEEETDATSIGVGVLWRRFQSLATLHLYCDMLPHFTRYNQIHIYNNNDNNNNSIFGHVCLKENL